MNYLRYKSAVMLLTGLLFAGFSHAQTNPMSNTTSISAKPLKAGYAPVNGINMYYEIYGNGEPLVLIHGGGSTIESNWGRLIPLLAGGHTVIAMELQAHGRTADREAPESFVQDADDVAALLKHLQIVKADFMGFSNGGQTLFEINRRHPELIRRQIIASAFYKKEGAPPQLWEFMPKATLENMPAKLKTAYLKVNNSEAGLRAMHDRDRDRMLHFKDWPDETISNIAVPTLILIGIEDVVTPEHAVAMYRLLPQGKLLILPGGHGTCLGEVVSAGSAGNLPEATAGMITDFLK